MSYYIGKMTGMDFGEAREKLTEELQKEGFGIITEINVRETLKKKLDLDFRPYIILNVDDKIGVLLPCNFVIQQTDEGTEIFALNPAETMGKLLGDEMEEISLTITRMVQNVLDRV